MKLIALNKITDNMVLAKNVYAKEGNVLLAKGTPLKQNYALRLPEWGVNSVYIQDARGDQLEIDEELYQQTQDEVMSIMNDFLTDLNSEHLLESVRQMVTQTMKQILLDKNILRNLIEINSVNSSIFRHCVNVSILSMIMGAYAGYGVNELHELACGAILIDVGKIMLAPQLIDDQKLLTPEEILESQGHTQQGFDKLQQLKGDYLNAAQVVLQHHEKYDGSGFPQGLKGNQIHEYARIAAIADEYDSQPNNLKDDLKLTIENIEARIGTSFDPNFTRLFSQKVAPIITKKEDNTKALPIEQDNSSEVIEHNALNLKSAHDLNNRYEVKQSQVGEREYTVPNLSNVMGEGQHQAINHQDNAVEWESQLLNKDQDIANAKYEFILGETAGLSFKVTVEQCQQVKAEALQIMGKTLAKVSTELVPKEVLEVIRTTISELVSENDIASNLVTIKALNDNTFSHCIAVSLLSVMTGASLGYNSAQLKELGTGSLLVDLGKVELSRKYFVDSRTIGTSEHTAVMPEHTQLGFEQLWKLKGNTNSPYIALQHHEKFDGSGYPAGLKGHQINEFARIVALADAYDTLINDGINGQKLMPHEVIEYIRDYSGSHFDPELSRIFLQNVTPFLIGSNVLLNTGEKAKVIRIDKDFLARPVIRVMVDSAGNKLSQPIEKDLVTDLTLFIISVLKDDEF